METEIPSLDYLRRIETERDQLLLRGPGAIVDIRIMDMSFESEVERIWPDSPDWLQDELSNQGHDWIVEEVFPWTYTSGKGDTMIQHGLVTGDLMRFRVFQPWYSQDYWGDGDVQYFVDLVDVYRGIKSQLAREWLTSRSAEQFLEFKRLKRIEQIAAAKFIRKHRRFWRISRHHVVCDTPYWRCSLVFEWPAQASRLHTASSLWIRSCMQPNPI